MKVIIGIILIIIAYASFEAYSFWKLTEKSGEVSNAAKAFEQFQDEPVHLIMVLGDSTAVGVGARDPRDSIAGRIGERYPKSTIVNRGRNGMKIRELLQDIQTVPEDQTISLMLLQIGGNDILRFTNLDDVQRDLRQVLQEATNRSDNVIVMTSGNVGAAPAFAPVTSRIYQLRTRQVRHIFLDETEAADVTYIDLYLPRSEDPFVADPEQFHSQDGLHPNSAGYGLWFEKVLPVLTL